MNTIPSIQGYGGNPKKLRDQVQAYLNRNKHLPVEEPKRKYVRTIDEVMDELRSKRDTRSFTERLELALKTIEE